MIARVKAELPRRRFEVTREMVLDFMRERLDAGDSEWSAVLGASGAAPNEWSEQVSKHRRRSAARLPERQGTGE